MLNNISVIPSVNNFVIGASRSRAHRLQSMKRKPLSDADRASAANLRRLWDAKKSKLGLTQDKAAEELGFGTQGAVSHYLNAYTPLNTDTVLKFAALLKVSPSEIDPNITDLLAHAGLPVGHPDNTDAHNITDPDRRELWGKVMWLWNHADPEIMTMFKLLIGAMYHKKAQELLRHPDAQQGANTSGGNVDVDATVQEPLERGRTEAS